MFAGFGRLLLNQGSISATAAGRALMRWPSGQMATHADTKNHNNHNNNNDWEN